MEKKICVGVVGLGHRGREIIKLSGVFDCVKVVAMCDIRPHNFYETQWLSDKPMSEYFPEAQFYESYDEMLDKAAPDVVIVETGADIHAEFCAKALKKNVNVLTDIPVVASLEEAEMLWNTAKDSKAMISVGANPNYRRFTYMLRDFYAKGLLGKAYCMEAEYIHWYLPGSQGNIHLNENGDWRKLLIPIRYCTHSLGPLLTIVDEELRYCSCFGTGPQTNESAKDDMMCAQFRTESGVIIRLMRNGRCRANIGTHNYRVFGTEGYMELIVRFGKKVIRYNSMKELDTSLREVDGKDMLPKYEKDPKIVGSGHGGLDYAMLDEFYNAVLSGGEAPVSLKEGLAMTLPGIYAEESAKRNGEVLRMVYPWEEDWSTEIK